MTRDDTDPVLLRELLDYDPQTGDIKWRPRGGKYFSTDRVTKAWNSRYAGKVASNLTVYGYRSVSILGKSRYAHRVSWAIYTGEWPSGPIDHINHDRADNRIANLRDATREINNRNATKRSDNTSGVTGVTWDKQHGKWLVQIASEGRNLKIGRFVDFYAAVAARVAAQQALGYHENHGLARSTLDEAVMERLVSKRSVQDILLEALKRNKEK